MFLISHVYSTLVYSGIDGVKYISGTTYRSYRILLALPFNMNFYETSLGNFITRAFAKLNNTPGTS